MVSFAYLRGVYCSAVLYVLGFFCVQCPDQICGLVLSVYQSLRNQPILDLYHVSCTS